MIFGRMLTLRLMQQYSGKHTKKLSVIRSLLAGFIIFSSSAVLYVFWAELLDFIINWQMRLKEGNLIFSAWKDVPFPLQIKIHVFQITNGRNFLEGKAWPVVSEVGPFTFKEYRNRDVISWSTDKAVVKFTEHLRFEFDESESIAPLSSLVTVVNTPLLLILGFVESKVTQFYLSMFTPVVNNIVTMIFTMYNESLIERRTVEEVLNGREVGILKMVDTMASPLRSLGISVPDLGVGMYKLTESSFGFIRMRDNQTFGPMETYTGQTAASRARFNNFASVEGKTSLPFYRSKRCNAILGTDGTFFGAHPPANKNATLYIFNMHLCRPMKFIYEGKSSVQLIKTYRYMADYRQFSIVAEPENWCFCPEDENITRCEGVLFMRQCLDGAPLVLSNPHFLYSPRLMAKVRGLSPNYEKHQGYIEVERTLGTSTEVILKMQLNVDMKPYSAVNSLSKFRPVIMPWIWVEEGTVIQGYLKYLMIIASNFICFAEDGFIMMGAMGVLMMLKSVAVLIAKQVKNLKKVIPGQNENAEKTEKNVEVHNFNEQKNITTVLGTPVR